MSKKINLLVVSAKEERHTIFSAYASELLQDAGLINTYSISDAENVALGNLPIIIFCDEYVGGEHCSYLFNKLKNYQTKSLVYFIVVTEKEKYEDLKKFIDAGFDDYLIGDKKRAVILNRIRIAARNIELESKLIEENEELKELKNLYKQELDDIKSLSIKLIESKIPSARGMLSKIADISIWIATQLKSCSEEEIFDIEIASYYSQVGRLFLPDEMIMLPVMNFGNLTNREMASVPASAKEILSSMSRFENAANIAYHIWENFDGSGIPKSLQKWQIPIESRIIRVAIDYEENRYFLNLSPSEAVKNLRERINRLYDPKVISLLEQYKGNSSDSIPLNEMAVRLNELQPGMVLTREIKTSSGMKMLGAGTVMTEKKITLIKQHTSSDPIFGYIYIDKSFVKSKLGIS